MAFRTVPGLYRSYRTSKTPRAVFQTVTVQVYMRTRDGEKRKTPTRRVNRKDARSKGGRMSINWDAACRNLPVNCCFSKLVRTSHIYERFLLFVKSARVERQGREKCFSAHPPQNLCFHAYASRF
jgi:hypothetical protein